MSYPSMVYLKGERGKYHVVNNASELVIAAEEGFFPMGLKSKKEVMEKPSVMAELKAQEAEKLAKKKEEDLIANAIKTQEENDKLKKKVAELEKKKSPKKDGK